MTVFLKADMEKIWNWLEKRITPENRKWLKKYLPGVWGDISGDSQILWRAKHADTASALCFRIQEALDVIAERTETLSVRRKGLPMSYLHELAQMLHLDGTEKTPEREMMNLILQKIEEEND